VILDADLGLDRVVVAEDLKDVLCAWLDAARQCREKRIILPTRACDFDSESRIRKEMSIGL
jgi:hypothetical protein